MIMHTAAFVLHIEALTGSYETLVAATRNNNVELLC